MVVRWAKVRNPDGVVRSAVSFSYHPIMVANIKDIPSRLREWIPELKVWLIDPKQWEALMESEAATWTFTRDPALGRVVVEWWGAKTAVDPRRPGETKAECDARVRAERARKECTCGTPSGSITCPVHGLAAAYQRPGPRFQGFAEFAEAMRSGRVRFEGFSFDPQPSSAPPPAVRRGRGPTNDDYSVLGVSPGDPASVVKAAHRRLALELHPDRGGDQEKLKVVNVARDRIMAALGSGS